jgi:hypothetical protein
MLSPPDIQALIDETAQYFADRKDWMSRSQGVAQRLNLKRAKILRRYQRHLADGSADLWIAAMEQETLAGRANYDADLRTVAAQFIVQGEPLPPVLRRYTRKVLHGTFQPKHSKKGKHAGDNFSRDLLIAARIDFIHQTYGIPCTGNYASYGRNAPDGHVSPAGRNRSACGGRQQHVVEFLVAPVGIGAVMLALFAFAWHNLVARGVNKDDTWPIRWW